MPFLAATIRIPSTAPDLAAALEGLVRLNQAEIRQAKASGRPIPPLYRAGVHWQPDRAPGGKPAETWDSIEIVRARGYGDCEDLASWRAAELRENGIAARAIVRRSHTPGVAWHCVTLWPNGQMEDPSAKLGMHEMQARIRAAKGGQPPGAAVVGADLARFLRTANARVAAWAAKVEARNARRRPAQKVK